MVNTIVYVIDLKQGGMISPFNLIVLDGRERGSMSNHSSSSDSEMFDLMSKQMGLGATKKFPEGKLTAQDEGELMMAIIAVNGKVVINFGTPTAWIGFTKEQAYELANTLRDKANSL